MMAVASAKDQVNTTSQKRKVRRYLPQGALTTFLFRMPSARIGVTPLLPRDHALNIASIAPLPYT